MKDPCKDNSEPWKLGSLWTNWYRNKGNVTAVFFLPFSHLLQKGLGQQGCGAFDLLFPDTAFHHVYVERDCYYLLRDKQKIGILGRQSKTWKLSESQLVNSILMVSSFVFFFFSTIVLERGTTELFLKVYFRFRFKMFQMLPITNIGLLPFTAVPKGFGGGASYLSRLRSATS